MSFLKTLGNLAPLASLIPGVGPLAGAAIGAGGKLLAGGGAEGALTGGAEGALGGLANKAMSDDSSFASKLGGAVKNTFEPNGQLDLSKILGVGGGIASMIGAGQQRKSAQNYGNAQIAQRNALMSKILAPQDYGFSKPPVSSGPGF